MVCLCDKLPKTPFLPLSDINKLDDCCLNDEDIILKPRPPGIINGGGGSKTDRNDNIVEGIYATRSNPVIVSNAQIINRSELNTVD